MSIFIDILIVIVIFCYIYSGYRQGFLRTATDVLGIIISFMVALKFYAFAGQILVSFGLNQNLAKPIGFFVLWTIAQIIFWLLTIWIFHYVPHLLHENRQNKIFGTIAGALKGLMVVAIFLMILMILPFSANVKNNLSQSLIAGNLIKATAKIENQLENIFGQINNTLTFTGVTAETDSLTKLDFSTSNFQDNQEAEAQMFFLTNEARAKNGLPELKVDPLIRNVARAHSMDMLQRGYFAHSDPNGLTPADRLTLSRVTFQIAGENLALAPSIDLAQIGLMNSPKHRENILDPEYGRVGIGVMDAGPYGLMITEDFAN